MKITLKPYSDANKPALKYVVRYPEDGRARRKFFKTKQAAQVFVGRLESIRARGGHDAASLPAETLREVLECLARLKPFHASLSDAVNAYVHKAAAAAELRSISWEDAIEQFLEHRAKRNLRDATLRTLRVRLSKFASDTEALTPAEITRKDLQGWIEAAATPRSAINRRLALTGFFKWAEREGYASNFVREIEPPKADDPEPEILSLQQCRRLMEETAAHKGGKWVPYVALTLFAGIRPVEVERLSWGDIDLEAGTVTISGKAAKLRARRIFHLADNAVEWLAPHALNQTPLYPSGSTKNLRAIRNAAGLCPWPRDAARHTCISAWMAIEGEVKAAAWAGNSPDVCHRHYKGLMPVKTAKAFFKITPSEEQILKFESMAI